MNASSPPIRCSPATSTSTVVLIVLLKTVIVFAFLLVATMLMIWFERKIIGDMQNRIGPNRAGPFGLLQTLADGIKVFFKEDLIPDRADRLVFKLAPYLSLRPRVPHLRGRPDRRRLRRRRATASSASSATTRCCSSPTRRSASCSSWPCRRSRSTAIMLAGWSSGSKYPLLGSVRASAQMVSYEAALGLSVVAVVLVSGTLSTNGIVAAQAGWDWNLWATGVVPFVIFLIAGTAELNRPPFDLVEAEQELVGGFHTEYCAHPLRDVLPGRVHEHDHHRRRSSSRCSSAARTAPSCSGPDMHVGPDLVLRQASSFLCSASCGSGPRCPGSATTS